jgi:hypothetical protein
MDKCITTILIWEGIYNYVQIWMNQQLILIEYKQMVGKLIDLTNIHATMIFVMRTISHFMYTL